MRDFELNVSVTAQELEMNLDIEDVIDIWGADYLAENLSSKVLLKGLNDQGHICMILTPEEGEFMQRIVLLLNACSQARPEIASLMEKLKCES